MNTQKPPSQRGCIWVENCIEGVRATFANPHRRQIRKVHYDGCYYTGRDGQADYILGLPGTVDVIVELKGTDTNFKHAALQVESTLDAWKHDPHSENAVAALIIYGRIEGKKKLPGRVPRASAMIFGLTAQFQKT